MKQIKKYAEIKVGEIAFESPDAGGEWNNEEGEILWKGTLEELKESEYRTLLEDWATEMEENDIAEYDLVVVYSDYGAVLYNYDNDPCGVVVFELQLTTEVKTLISNSNFTEAQFLKLCETEEITQDEMNDEDYMLDRLEVWEENVTFD